MVPLKLALPLLLIALQGCALATAECDLKKCEIPKHYREIGGCVPEYAEDDAEKCCPVKYNCDAIQKQDTSKCYYNGRVYEDGERIDHQISCRVGCYCRFGRFTCAHIDCPEFFGIRLGEGPDCIRQKSPGKCCTQNRICDKEEIDKLPVCYFEGRKYHGGEAMYPKERSCHTCYCDEKFDNSTAIEKNPNCPEVHCAIELDNLPQIRGSGCVPIYYDTPICCPIELKCRKLTETENKIVDKNKSDSKYLIFNIFPFLPFQPPRRTAPSRWLGQRRPTITSRASSGTCGCTWATR